MLPQQILNGVVEGCIFTLFSLGFTIIFGFHRILNMAHGGVFMAGALLGYYCVDSLELPLLAALLAGSLGAGLLSVAIDLFAFRPLRKRTHDEFASIVLSIGVNLLILNIGQQLTQSRNLNFPFDAFPIVVYDVLGLRVSLMQIAIIACSAVLVAALYFYLFRSRLGMEVRAVAVNERTASLLGVDPGFVYLQTFFLAGAMAGAAGVILGVAYNTVGFGMGESIMTRAFAVVIMGGLGSVGGTIVAGLLLGIAHAVTTAYVSAQMADIGLFLTLVVVLLVRPSGLFRGLHLETRKA